MAEYLAPGVYIEEIERGPRPIEGVATSTAAFLGETERGPVRPRLVTSFNDFRRHFGGFYDPAKYLPYATNGFFENGGRRCYIARITGEGAARSERDLGGLIARAVGPGTWGDRVKVLVSGSSTKAAPAANGDPVPVGFRLRIAYWAGPGAAPDFDPFLEASRKLANQPVAIEEFDDLVLDEASPDHYAKRVNGNSALIELAPPAGAAPARPAPSDIAPLAGGSDGGAIDTPQYVGDALAISDRRGLSALKLDEYRDVAIVYAPAVSGTTIDAIITHCELSRFRFAVVDSPRDQANADDLQPRNRNDSQYAAFYYPWLRISDPLSGAIRTVPPGGHVIGVYARTDTERGVFKAPANEVVNNVIALEYDIDQKLQETLNPRGVNAIRRFPGRGIRIWGARTLSSNTLWKYVSVRRLFIFLERSIYEGTQWVVFEPNDERLWDRVKDTVRVFLRGQWRLGALMGRTEQEAFFVTCDRTVMTQDDILNGRLICEIGIAPVRPAEFVIFRIFQNTAEAES